MLEASLNLTDGFRGAPVFAGDGAFVGMVSETDGGVCRILPTETLSALASEDALT